MNFTSGSAFLICAGAFATSAPPRCVSDLAKPHPGLQPLRNGGQLTMKETPYWWEHAPPTTVETPTVPTRADVAVIGSGYTGLSAALTLARAGRSVVVFESGTPGVGASSRNGGMLGSWLKPSLDQLT